MGILSGLKRDLLRSRETESVIESMLGAISDDSVKNTFLNRIDVEAETMDIDDPEINSIIDMIPEAGARSEEEIDNELSSLIESAIPETTI